MFHQYFLRFDQKIIEPEKDLKFIRNNFITLSKTLFKTLLHNIHSIYLNTIEYYLLEA